MTLNKSKNLSGKIVRDIPRVDKDLLEKLGQYSTTIISDCLQRFGCMDAAIKPVAIGTKMIGPAFTVEEIEGGNLMSHFALKYVQPGDVIVIDQKGITSRAGWGGVQAYAAKKKQAAGVVIDGAIRDVDEIRDLGLPVYCRAVTPAGPHKGWGGNINIPISCAGVPIMPGDIIVGDDNGVVIVPSAKVADVIETCQEREDKEKDWYKRMDEGQETTDFMNFTPKLEEFDIEVE